jgi:hypothetical protein
MKSTALNNNADHTTQTEDLVLTSKEEQIVFHKKYTIVEWLPFPWRSLFLLKQIVRRSYRLFLLSRNHRRETALTRIAAKWAYTFRCVLSSMKQPPS